MKIMHRVINFSGGKTSAYMTIKYYRPGDIVLFCDTGREHPKTYKFINDFEANENIPVTRVSYKESEKPFDAMMQKYNYSKLPNKLMRFCTIELKVKTAKRYLRSIGLTKYEQMIGFRSDEPQRVKRHIERFKKVKTLFPLYYDGVDKPIINDYWSRKSYNLEIPSILGNCTLCFMKGKNALIAILREYPELAEEWILDEERGSRGYSYIKGITYRQMLNIAQNNLFKDYDLNEIAPAFNCACTA